MRRHRLGTSDLSVPDLCLGTMTFGTQTPEDDGHRQIDMALEAGIDFLDTAEMYPVNPVRAETVGLTETIVGNWVAKSGRRADVTIATKISGQNSSFVRPGRPIDAASMAEAVEGSLRRLQTDVIDLYQLHWPNRGSYQFRQNWTYDPSKQDRDAVQTNMIEVLEAMARLQASGKVRYFGLSNESAWGTAEWLRLAGEMGAPRMASIQNEYSLMCRLFDTDLAELCVNERVGLLAFSPLATGLLTGKYKDGSVPEGSRKSFASTLGGRDTLRARAAVNAYLEIAAKHGLDPVHLALGFCQTRPFMGSVIFGATTTAQLETVISGKDTKLSTEVLKDITKAHMANPMPY